MPKKYVYFFSKEKTDGTRDLKDLLGGKGANLAEMCNLGLPIPPGFTLSSEVCELFYENDNQCPSEVVREVDENLRELEKTNGKKLGDPDDPLLVSVRSGAAISMPGMMDTVLNLGLNDQSVKGLARQSRDARFATDSYRRFIQMFGDVVLGIPHGKFEEILDYVKTEADIRFDVDLSVDQLRNIIERYKKLIREETGDHFPQDPQDQLWKSIHAVFGSWNNERAIKYRQMNKIEGLRGTAVNIQTMVFGNLGKDSGTGVTFSRNPSTGENRYYGEYLINAQGEDVVAGIRDPKDIAELEKDNPVIYRELLHYKKILEEHYKDMQDMEFTIQRGTLYFLQTRTGKRTAPAAIKIAIDMLEEGLINREEAVMRVAPDQLDQLLHPAIDPDQEYSVLARGLPASPGAAVGRIVFSAQAAEQQAGKGEQVILVRKETSPEDIGGMDAAQGILTSTGGMTSHAAVVARGMGKCCVVGCQQMVIRDSSHCEISGKTYREGDYLTLDGTKGEVIDGQLKLKTPEISDDFQKFIHIINETKDMGVRTNADTPKDSAVARKFGAEGIGLCRTEHMFFEGDRIDAVREMILSADTRGREKALAKILPMQVEDFEGIFKAMDGLPVTIRLLDPPLHEFLPHQDSEIEELARTMHVDPRRLQEKVNSLKELNPMLGHRGCRLAITYPEIARMQTRAIIEAALKAQNEGIRVFPEIMIPLTGTETEFNYLKKIIEEEIQGIFDRGKTDIEYKIGTMIEIPRACLVADRIAAAAEFFSFGTNDLTQMTFGYSRDDAGVFLPDYISKGILPRDPFQVLDTEGVGKLVKIALEKGRGQNPHLKVGICGEHGGEPASVEFCYQAGMDYVSCSPYRVPIAKLAAAQARIKKQR